ncbi:MAG: hypothetical protein IKD83_03380 [Firmicutes bacterium]|nr:hypothetical protein [Bacillota bacterium]
MDDLYIISSVKMMLYSKKVEIFGEKAMEFTKKIDEALNGFTTYKVYLVKYNGQDGIALTNLIKGCPVIINTEYKMLFASGLSPDFDLPETYTDNLEDFVVAKDKVKAIIEEYGY